MPYILSLHLPSTILNHHPPESIMTAEAPDSKTQQTQTGHPPHCFPQHKHPHPHHHGPDRSGSQDLTHSRHYPPRYPHHYPHPPSLHPASRRQAPHMAADSVHCRPRPRRARAPSQSPFCVPSRLRPWPVAHAARRVPSRRLISPTRCRCAGTPTPHHSRRGRG